MAEREGIEPTRDHNSLSTDLKSAVTTRQTALSSRSVRERCELSQRLRLVNGQSHQSRSQRIIGKTPPKHASNNVCPPKILSETKQNEFLFLISLLLTNSVLHPLRISSMMALV